MGILLFLLFLLSLVSFPSYLPSQKCLPEDFECSPVKKSKNNTYSANGIILNKIEKDGVYFFEISFRNKGKRIIPLTFRLPSPNDSFTYINLRNSEGGNNEVLKYPAKQAYSLLDVGDKVTVSILIPTQNELEVAKSKFKDEKFLNCSKYLSPAANYLYNPSVINLISYRISNMISGCSINLTTFIVYK